MIQDRFIIGFAGGLLAPLMGFYLYYLSLFRQMGIDGFYHSLVANNKLAAVISLSLLANLALFFLFDRFDKLKCARGVIAGTFIYGFYIVYLKFF
jgi:hypothetical protein